MPVTMTRDQAGLFQAAFGRLVTNVSAAVLGKAHVIRLAVACLLAEGHLLLEDAPGTGKTSLARALAATVDCPYSRIQFTPDLLPSDVTGVTVLDQRQGDFVFRPGPVFASIVLADEINRASPKTQSALLEVMEEGQVTVDGMAHDVGRPFMVIATQNPIEQAGTYPLPEAQLDRFLMKTAIGYPDAQPMLRILGGDGRRDRVAGLQPVVTADDVLDLIEAATLVHTHQGVLDYVIRLAEATREAEDTRLGVSVRGAMALVRVAKVWAAAQGREYVLPDDIKDLAGPVWTHRLLLDPEAEFAGVTPGEVVARLLDEVPAPAGPV
jgi:MoxR-like ATPase